MTAENTPSAAITVTANPYAAPQAVVADGGGSGEIELAERSSRLGALLADGLTWFLVIVIAVISAIGADRSAGGSMAANLGLGVAAIGALILVVMNLLWIHRHGQTIGKRLLKIRIVRTDGSRAGTARIIFLRGLVMGLLQGLPYAGPLIWLVDSLFIFRDDRRCVHDHIAGTIVIKALPAGSGGP